MKSKLCGQTPTNILKSNQVDWKLGVNSIYGNSPEKRSYFIYSSFWGDASIFIQQLKTCFIYINEYPHLLDYKSLNSNSTSWNPKSSVFGDWTQKIFNPIFIVVQKIGFKCISFVFKNLYKSTEIWMF
jgi:hypothetical protein